MCPDAKKNTYVSTFIFLLLSFLPLSSYTLANTDKSSNDDKELIKKSSGNLSIIFEPNMGQTDEQVRFLARGRNHTLFLTPYEAVLSLMAPVDSLSKISNPVHSKVESASPKTKSAALRLHLLNGKKKPNITGENKLTSVSNYFRGKEHQKWQTGIPHYGRVRYKEVYEGIDLVYFGSEGKFEYDFIISPGAEPSTIKLHFDGAENIRLDQDGNLILTTEVGKILQQRPIIYQKIDGKKKTVAGGYQLDAKNEISFQLAEYDKRFDLVIDPVIIYSTYLGGSDSEYGEDIAVDSIGNAYITGRTPSSDFPSVSAIYPNYQGGYYDGSAESIFTTGDAFIVKLSSDGQNILYSTYFGGSNFDFGSSIAVDNIGNAYVTGSTQSSDFPTVNALYPDFLDELTMDAFILKLSSDGQNILYSTYLGANNYENDYGEGIAVDSNGNAYVTGTTKSSSFPIVNALYPNLRGGSDAFIFKLSSDGQSVIYSTYIGGNSSEDGNDITVDNNGNAYVTGLTYSSDFPTVNAIYPNFAGGNWYDAFVIKLSSDGQDVVYSTYLGGTDFEYGTGIAVDSSGNSYVTGLTRSSDFPTINAIYPSLWGYSDAFVVKLSSDGQNVLYSTYLGGSSSDEGHGIAVDTSGNAYVTGVAGSDFPTVNALYPNLHGLSDAYIFKLSSNGQTVINSTFIGGSHSDLGNAIAVDTSGNAYVTGYTYSSDFPMVNAVFSDQGFYDAFIVKTATDAVSDNRDYFEFSTISSQTVGVPFLVTVRLEDSRGVLQSDFNSPITLISDARGMEIISSSTLNGIATFSVSFAEQYSGNRLHAQNGSVHGDSKFFDISGGAGNGVTSVKGRVVNSSDVGLLATVHLENSLNDFQDFAVGGDFDFTAAQNIPTGRYNLWTEIGGIRYGFNVSLGAGFNNVGTITTVGNKPPVILVPGFMGSDKKRSGGLVYPKLPESKPANQNDLILHDPRINGLVDIVGWNKLKEELTATGFEVFECPWDWRLRPDDKDAQDYLTSTIAWAKLSTGAAKVDIVAHSMGGLLVREYIQGDDFNHDIDRFAMVGTPNHGALLAYPAWVGGDPVIADFIAGNSGPYLSTKDDLYFYSNTLDRLYKTMEDTHLIAFDGKCGLMANRYKEPEICEERSKIRDFLHDEVEGLGTLLITDYYCLNGKNGCSEINNANTYDYVNQYLKDLNNSSKSPNILRLTDGTVNTKIFASNSEAMVKNVTVKDADDGVFEENGEPQRPFTELEVIGDGTVLYQSAMLSPVPMHTAVNKDEHKSLIKKYSTEIKDFLKEGRILSPTATPATNNLILTAAQATSMLSLNVDKGYPALLTGPDNARNGIDLEADADYAESVGTTFLRDSKNASVSLLNPVNGIYEVKLTGTLQGYTNIIIAWFNADKLEELELDIYFNAPSTTFKFKLDPAADPVLSLVADIGAPQNFTASDNAGNTSLQWTAPIVGTAVSYNVYSKKDFQNNFTLLNTVSAPTVTLDILHPYNTPRMVYAVSAVDSLGNESVLSRIIDNQPVVITTHEYKTSFPWTMFLPAITNNARP